MYCKVADLQALVSDDRLLQLADDTGLATLKDKIVQAVLTAAIDRADREIDGYVSSIMPVPLAEAPGLITNLSAKIAVYNLHRRRPHLGLDEWKDEYPRAVRTLEQIAQGKIALVRPGETAQASAEGVSVRAGRLEFSDRELMKY